MDNNQSTTLNKILTTDELNKTPDEIKQKLEIYLTEKYDEFLTTKAIAETAKTNYDEAQSIYEHQVTDLTSQVQDLEFKLGKSQQSVDELRKHLNEVILEKDYLAEKSNKYEAELIEIRRNKNFLVDERDSLLKMVERQASEIERIQTELKMSQNQLKSAINSKCEAMARFDEVQSKESSIEFKEKRMDQERNLLTNQIHMLTEDLNRNIAELQTIRRDNTLRYLQLETKLTEKSEELKIVNQENANLKESNESLGIKAHELSTKLFKQCEEANHMISFYKKELQAKTKLSELYKMTNDDRVSETTELETAICELKRMLSEASEQYGELETKLKSIELKHQQEIDEKDKLLQARNDQLVHANQLIKDVQNESLENAVGKLAPSAAVANRLMKADMSLTELYSLYVKATEDSEFQKRENGKLNLQIKTILQELEERAPIMKKQELEYQKLIESNTELTQQLENIIIEKSENLSDLKEAQIKVGQLERENKKLKLSQNDLGRQVCYLLKEMEQIRSGFGSERNGDSLEMSTEEVISKKLVTFASLAELQENNQKLLLLVRDLSSKLEEFEVIQQNYNESAYQSKIDSLSKRLLSMQESFEDQKKVLNTYMAKCERLKRMYSDLFINDANIKKKNEQMDVSDNEKDATVSENKQIAVDPIKEKRIKELETLVQEQKMQLNKMKTEYEEYISEKKKNEKIMNEQFDSMRTEVRDITSNNCKLLSTIEYNSEQIKLQQKNIDTYKKQISALEERKKNYENTIVKHEHTLLYLKDEVMNSQKKLVSSEIQMENFKQECRLLKDTESRLQVERESLLRERQTQSLLLNNLEMIKASFERSETEGRIRLETRLDEANRELSALRRRLQEEQDHFRELSAELGRQTEKATLRMEEESKISDNLQKDIEKSREELSLKSKQIEELNRKLQDSLTPNKNDNPIALANKKARDIQIKYDEAVLEIKSLNKELEKAKKHANQYCKMSESAERELKELYDMHSQYIVKTEQDLETLRLSESSLQAHVSELQTEIQLKKTTAQMSNESYPTDVHKIQEELKESLQKLSYANREIRILREQNSNLSANLNRVEQKYANEMMLHSSDIQEMANFKEELNKIKQQHNDLVSTKENAVTMYEENKKKWEELEKMFNNENEELQKRLIDLDKQNSYLHEQLQSLTAKQMVYMDEQKPADSSMSSDLNRSVVEDECQGNEKLLQIIKFLRKEKQIAVAKVDILKSENVRLMSEQVIAQKKIDELNSFLNEERTKSETEVVTASRHEEILRKIETLNAITDSNRILREERDTLSGRVKKLVEQVSKIEDQLLPVQLRNRELNSKIEQLNAENCTLRTETGKWRQRANSLIDKSNKNPEEFKRLQTERENLAKMLTVEKDNIQKITEELNALKLVKSHLDNEVLNLQKQLHLSNEEKKKIIEEYNVLKAQNTQLLNEITEHTNKLLQSEEQLKKLKADLVLKDAQFLDTKKKEIQIRKIAKRYKDSFIELKNKESSADEVQIVVESGEPSTLGYPSSEKVDLDKSMKDKINELNALITSSQEENDKLKKEIEELKQTTDKEGRGKLLLLESKSKIISLTQANNAISQELSATKNNLEALKKSCEEQLKTMVNSIKEETIAKMAKEQGENEQSKETISRLTRENENLLMRVNQVNRQLGLQQVSKPSTSSGVVSDKGSIESPRTANVKPMSGTSVQQSATVTPWRGSETPLASIRPITVQNSRTAAILPTSQTANINVIQGSTGGMTALVPPQQQVHTTASSMEAMSSPTSSHTDYMPATSSAAIVVAAVPPMGSVTAESSQEAESITSQNESQVTLPGGQQQAVALVSPRIEGAQNVIPPPQVESQQEPNIQPSTSGTSSSTSHISISSHHHASSSNNVTTTQAVGNKRPRDNEGDSSVSNDDCVDKTSPLNKRTRQHMGALTESQGSVTESGLEVEYQVPTSSQRDQEYDIVIVDSEEEDGMSDEGAAENEDGPAEDQENDGYEESYDQNQDLDDADGPNIDESSNQPDNNEVEINDSNEAPAPRGSDVMSAASTSGQQPTINEHNQENNQQIQTISSGSGEADNVAQTSTWRQSTPLSRQQQATLIRLQKGCNEDVGCDSIVPSGSGTEVQAHGSGIRKIAESTRAETPLDNSQKNDDDDVIDNRIDVEDGYVDEAPTPKSEDGEDKIEPENVEENQHDEEVVEEGISTDEKSANEVDFDNSGPSQSLAVEGNLEEEVGLDGVTSEGEKTITDGEAIEEGREAEASTSLNITTRSKVFRGNQSIRRSERFLSRGGRPTPIIWQDQMNPNILNNRGHDMNNSSRNFQGQRGQRARRNRRPTGPVYGNPRY